MPPPEEVSDVFNGGSHSLRCDWDGGKDRLLFLEGWIWIKMRREQAGLRGHGMDGAGDQ